VEGLFRNKYRIPSARLSNWDYSSCAYYFITICAKNREEYFGEVLRDDDDAASVALSDVGKIARDCWLDIPNHFPNASLDEWVIMPNHAHGIVVIGENDARGLSHGRDVACNVSTNPRATGIDIKHASSDERKQWMSHISPAPSSLAAIIRSFKSAVTKQCREFGYDVEWQSRFYDRIIRNELVLYKIRVYIKNNPKMWYRDRNNTEGLLI